MNNKSILNASFEESLNLQDDEYRRFSQKSYEDCEKYFSNGGPSFLFSFIYFILSLIFPIGINLLIFIFTIGTQHIENKVKSLDIVSILIFITCFISWVVLILIGKNFSQQFIKIYRFQFHIQVTSIIWLVIQMNLFFILVIRGAIDDFTILGIFSLLLFLSVIMVKNRLKYFREIIFELQLKKDYKSNFPEKLAKIIPLGIILLIVIKIFFLALHSDFNVIIQSITLLISWVGLDIFILFYFIYIIPSHFLPAYFIYKYPEEYRDWENKSVEEWYGKKYLKKHKELIKND
ncbi:hypothetical protein K6W41_01060 [Streptococcus agalactiae]|uniref:hypothetical protein n=1 Tax=Streptococcus agalactiae TaxID=1311 RepID=UPI001C960429|nr:hypothetical protein [Streptococcus agalactiae]MBY4834548.1 hypothetical protein [Streptococcus agalactiae]MBY5052615.1 hypothetical protein [Streptococcus agalactiae]